MSDDPGPQAQEPKEGSARTTTPATEPSRFTRLRRDWRGRRLAFLDLRKATYRSGRETVRGWLEPVRKASKPGVDWIKQRRRWTYPVLGALVVIAAALLPYLGTYYVIPLWLQRITDASVLARVALFSLFALGLNVVVGFAGLLDLGYVAFWALGSYTAAILTGARTFSLAQAAGNTHVRPPVWNEWMWLIFPAALLVAVIAGIILGSPTLRLRGDYLAIVTLGFGEIVRELANNLDSFTGGPIGIKSTPHPAIHGFGLDIVWGTFLDIKYYWLLLALVVFWVVAIRMLDDSRIGRAWVAIREDEVAAASMGVPIVGMKLTAFAIGACTGGVGGAVYALQVPFINPPTFALIQSILILSCVVIGGMGSIRGAIFGAAAIVLLPELFRGFLDYRFFVFGAAIVVVMIFRPQGIFPSKRRTAELLGAQHDEQLYEAAQAGGA
ncbi:MAG TPA: branched-chain amino acid ABC transporter permease [Actinomycetota bacterium]|nr:branched-chain amino acid ABC transporter permease [Actinomycetota bacterium]